MLDVTSGESTEVGPRETDVWEFDWDGDGLCVAIVSMEPPVDPVGIGRTSRDSTWITARTTHVCTSRRGRSSGSRCRPTDVGRR